MEVLALRVVRHTRHFDAMLRFYQDVLEMRCTYNWQRPDSTGALLSPGRATGPVAIEILNSKDWKLARSKPGNVVLSLQVRDAKAWRDRLRKRGISIVEDLKDTPWGHRTFSIEDPDGMRVTLYQVIT